MRLNASTSWVLGVAMTLSGVTLSGVTLSGVLLSAFGCSRSPLRHSEVADETVPYVCTLDDDCVGVNACESYACVSGLCQLVRATTCDDGDPCTVDSCSPRDGSCQFTRRTGDDDGDGYPAALPGKGPGAPDACGNDCNDASPLAHPGADEICDGVDNDCNGIVDDTQRYYGPNDGLPDLHWVSETAQQLSYPAGLTYDGEKFAMITGEQSGRWQGVFHALDANGTVIVPATALTSVTNDSAAGPIVWTGSVFGTAWEDRRETSYDIYFNRLDALGKKLHPDLRVTASRGFSIGPSLVYDGTEWLLAYADDQDSGYFSIFTQRISKEATLVGLPVAVTPIAVDARQPRLSRNSEGFGLFYYSVLDKRFAYQRLDANLAPVAAAVSIDLGDEADASIRWNGDRYILVWSLKLGSSAQPNVWAMSIDALGRTLSTPRAITSGASHALSPSIVGFGDRFVLLWADDRFSPLDAQGKTYFDLSIQTFKNDLSPIDGQQQITALAPYVDSINPVGVLGGGALGVLFRSTLAGSWHTYFAALRCWNLDIQ